MKKILLIVSFMLSVLAVYSQTGIGTKTVDPSALMELQSTNKGFLPPRVKLLSGTDITTIPAPATGLTVYHTGIAGMPAGLYVNLGTSTSATWVNTSGSNWGLTGNAGTSPANNFIGTTDAVDFITRTNNTEKMRVTAAGKVGIGTTTPNGLLSFSNNFSTERQIVLREYNGGTDDNQFAGIGVGPAGTMKIHTAPLLFPIASLFRIQAGINSTSSEILMDVYPDGSFNIGGSRTTSIPATLLSVNGNTSVGGAIINLESPPIDVSTNTGTIPNNTSQVRLTGAATANITLTAPTAPINGQRLIIYNSTATFPALLNGIPVPAGQAMEFVYSGGWRGTNGGAIVANLWGINGNTGTNASTNFIGTVDNTDFVTRTNNTEKMRVTAAGYLGIGTNNPSGLVSIAADNLGAAGGNDFNFDAYGNSVGQGILLGYAGGNAAAPTNMTAGTAIGLYGFKPRINGNWAYGSSGMSSFYQGGGTNDLSDLRFTTSSVVRAIIDQNGNLGIGTTAPAQVLSVVDRANTNQYQGIASFLANNLTAGIGIGYNGLQAIGSNTNNDFYINGKGTGNLILQASNGATGKVGIGTAGPAAQLDVVGGGSTIGLRNAVGSWDNIWLSVDPAGYYSYVNASGADSGLQFRVGTNSFGTYGDGGQTLTTVVAMLPNGNVGIGNTAPTANLEVGSATGPANPILRLHSSGNAYGSGAILDFNENNTGYGTRIRHQTGANGTTQAEGLYFNALNNGAESASPILMIDQVNSRVGIGTAVPTQALHVVGDAYKTGGTSSWLIPSDFRVKKDIRPYTDGLQQILQIKPVFFKYNGKGGIAASTSDQVGVIAQEIQKVAPYTVKETDIKVDESGRGLLQLQKADAIMYMLVNGMKEQQNQIETQKKENSELKKQLAAQQEILSNLLKKMALLEQAISTKK